MVAMSKGRSGKAMTDTAATLRTLLLCGMTGVLCFYTGFLLGTSYSTTTTSTLTQKPNAQYTELDVQRRVQEEVSKASLQKLAAPTEDTASRFPTAVADFGVGVSRVGRDEFAAQFDTGVPLDPSTDKNSEVLILYSSEKSLPSSNLFAAKEATSQTTMPLLSATEATENCDFLNTILTDHSSGRRQCIALMGQYESFHVQKFMRLPAEGKLDPSAPLKLVNRGAQSSGRKSTKPPKKEDTLKYWSILSKYLNQLEGVLTQLRPIAEKVAGTDNTIVTLVCNFGQSELLVNFICSARSRGLDLSSVLVFATDQETYDLATSLGVSAFYDETNFESMPKEAAGRYADNTFTKMMLAKVYCVQMISMLGYDVLFQDVDVVWFRNPLDYFHDQTNQNAGFDVYFQDDGNHALFYAPYSANTGFYYVRSNEKTRHFFNSLLMAGDLIFSTHSHQVPLVALLSEHASMYGLKVKIFARTENEWPGGHAFHRRKDFMKDVIAGAEHPYIFHMSWTHSKDNKIKFFQQMGDWHVQNSCIQQTVDTITKDGGADVSSQCCVAQAVVTCHYRDKPSKIPCRESPPIDKGKPSFW